ncbi:hypothetical protein WDV06_36030, partial [Streptomyces racemochromogenes]
MVGSGPAEPGVEGGAVALVGVLLLLEEGVQVGGFFLVVLSLGAQFVLGGGQGLRRPLVAGQEVVVVGLPAALLAEHVLKADLEAVVEEDGLLVCVGHHQAFGEGRVCLPQGRGVQAQRQGPDLLARPAE